MSEFAEQGVERAPGESVRMPLAERGTRLGKHVWVREIRKLTGTGHQVSILSTNCEASMSGIAGPMFARWWQEIKSKAGKWSRKRAEFGARALPADAEAPRVAAYERAQGSLREEIAFLEKDRAALKAQRKETPRHVRWIDLPEPERFVPLAPARKHFLDTIRMIAYRAETARAGVLREVMTRPDDTRALLPEIGTTDADLLPDQAAGTLTGRLDHLTNRA